MRKPRWARAIFLCGVNNKVWLNAGFILLIFLLAIESIPRELTVFMQIIASARYPHTLISLRPHVCIVPTHTHPYPHEHEQAESIAMAASFLPLSRMRPLPPIHRDVFVGMIIFNLFGVVRGIIARLPTQPCIRPPNNMSRFSVS